MENNQKKKTIQIVAAIMLCIGILGSIYALFTINASEQAFQADNQVFRALRVVLQGRTPESGDAIERVFLVDNQVYQDISGFIQEAHPDATEQLVRPAREYARPMTANAIITLSILVASVLLLFIGGGLLITKASNKEKIERIQQSNISLLTFSALCVALAVILSQIRLFQMPQGGSITAFSMLPIVLVGYWYGVKAGISAGFVYGLLRLMLGATVIHPVQFLLDYPLAYAALGAFCLFREKRFGLQISFLAGATGRFLCSFIGGIVFFGEFAPPDQPVWIYSAIYNVTYIAPEAAITLIILSMPPVMKAIEQLRLMRAKGAA